MAECTDVQGYYDGSWFRFTDGRLVPAETPEWAPQTRCLGPADLKKGGFEDPPHEWDGDLISINLYTAYGTNQWLAEFFEQGDSEYVVEIEGFPDWLEFRRYVAPIITVNVLKDLNSVANITVKRLLPDRRPS